MFQVRPPAVAGSFYNADQQGLSRDVAELLVSAANTEQKGFSFLPKALIVPHAGYIYSGPIAASAYIHLQRCAKQIRRVLLLGPVHRVPVRGLALPECKYFSTPLGNIEIDLDAAAAISHLPQVVSSSAAHAEEHSLEVQLPFLQSILTDFKCLPLAVGDASPNEIAEVLEILWGGDETLIIISSDLSHFLPYSQAQLSDTETVQNILNLKGGLNHKQACGGTPLNGFLLAAKKHQLQPSLLDQRNSGDTAGDKNRVVGYASIIFTRTADSTEQNKTKGTILTAIARDAIRHQLQAENDSDHHSTDKQDWLQKKAACFVTLKKDGQLRGCIGSLQAVRPLWQDVSNNASAAAFRDPRFPPLKTDEFDSIDIEISLLSETEALVFDNEEQALAQVRPDIDGLVFEYGHHRSTFLPQVWQQLPTIETFMAHLKQKAGLPADFWHDEIRLSRYTVEKWQERDEKA